MRAVDVGLDVALHPGIAVPVPGAAEVAPGLDHPEVVDSSLTEARSRAEAAEAAADDRDRDLVVLRLAGEARLDVGIVHVGRELASDVPVLIVAVGPEPLVALLPVLLSQGVGIEAQVGALVRGSQRHRSLLPGSPFQVVACTSREAP